MIIELSHLITDGMPVYPGDAETALLQSNFMDKDHFNNFELMINMHAGTHIDGPMHLTDSSIYISELPLDTFIGEGCLIDVSRESSIDYKEMYEDFIHENQIVIVHTGHSRYYGQAEYFLDYPVVDMEFAKLLVRKKVKMIGLDSPSPDKAPYDIHKYLLSNGILIIENLTNVERLLDFKSFEIIALPLNIMSDSSIARVAARVEL